MHQPLIDTSLNEYDSEGYQTRFAIAPFGNSETRQQRLDRWQAMGSYDPDCVACHEFRDHPRLAPFAPSHKPGGGCRSGKRPHCTCPTCWG